MTSGAKLTDEELAVLGVSRETTEYGYDVYTIPCVICGLPVRERKYSTKKIYKCRLCRDDVLRKQHAKKKIAIEQHERMMAEEVGSDYAHYHRFESGVKKFGIKYLSAITQAEKVMYKFESVPEVVACIELLYIGARVIPHQSVGGFTVDFCLPDEKVVIEIDGSIYHADSDKEYRRDYAIKNMLGSGWVIRHIPSDAVMKNHEAFGKGIKRLIDDRRFELNI